MLSLSPLSSFLSIIVLTIALAFTYSTYMTSTATEQQPMQAAKQAASSISKAIKMSNLSHAKIELRPSSKRGHADHGWLNTYHSFSFASYYEPNYESFGSLRVLNEDRVAPGQGFPTHPHRDAEIFSYILSGELTHRDSLQKKGLESNDKDKFFRMKRGDVQFTTGGTGIAHSEGNEHNKDWVHFLQIWALPWKRGLPPIYHTNTFNEEEKRKGFVNIITPLKAGPTASPADEKAAVPATNGTIPIHADMVFSAGIIPAGGSFEYKIGGDDAVQSKNNRNTYVHLPMTKGGKAKIRLAGRDDKNSILKEGDGAFIRGVNAGDVLTVESIGDVEAEVVVLDSN
jgi:quercetin 2,3-dioxygenase